MIGKLQEVPVFSGPVSPKSWQVFQSCVAGSSGCWGESVGLFLPPAGALLLIVTCCSCSPGWFDSECGHVQLSQENEGWRSRACVTGDPPPGGQLGKVPQSGQGPGRRVRWLFQKSIRGAQLSRPSSAGQPNRKPPLRSSLGVVPQLSIPGAAALGRSCRESCL